MRLEEEKNQENLFDFSFEHRCRSTIVELLRRRERTNE